MNVARAWAKAWAIMKGVEVPDALPDSFVKQYQEELGHDFTLSEAPKKVFGAEADNVRQMAESAVTKIKETVFTLLRV